MASVGNVQVVEKNVGTKIEWLQNKYKLVFGDDDLAVNCSTRQREQDIEVDICYDSEKNLVIGTAKATAYVAQILIPGFEYEEKEETGEDGEKTVVQEQLPLDMSKVVLTLWSIEGK